MALVQGRRLGPYEITGQIGEGLPDSTDGTDRSAPSPSHPYHGNVVASQPRLQNMALKPGQRLGSLEVFSLLGAGGMGEVYRARDMRLGRDVAVKVLPDSLSKNQDLSARLEQEAAYACSPEPPQHC